MLDGHLTEINGLVLKNIFLMKIIFDCYQPGLERNHTNIELRDAIVCYQSSHKHSFYLLYFRVAWGLRDLVDLLEFLGQWYGVKQNSH